MSDSQHRLVLAKYNGVVKPIACHLSGQASPLVALSNYLTLKLGGEAKETIPSHVQESHLIECIQSTLLNLMPHFAERRHVSEIPNKKEHFLQNVVPSLAKGVRLNASCRGTQDFKLCDELLVFYSVDAKLVHGWLSDPDDKEVFDVIGKCTHGSLLRRINEEGIKELVSGSKNPSSLVIHKINIHVILFQQCRFKILCKELNEHQLAILCIKDQFDVICKYSGDLFVLVTDEHILMRFGEALWKRLAMTEEETFYVSMEFVPIKGQQNYPKVCIFFLFYKQR
ncbi:hypothetical protein HU200_033362 [Digitaria exilis]|uniref:MINDY deubiquitinase domain-containing protein n=1 Tax=Digitaria exilis TaxID=1010633 RepID=A0A835BMX0_9POAL|nr:hypothetical protein HU200_033362 [Digitaria exilis]